MDTRAAAIFSSDRRESFERTDRLFAGLMLVQWLVAIVVALWMLPRAATGIQANTRV